LTWWLEDNQPHPPERMNEMFRQRTQPVVEAVMIVIKEQLLKLNSGGFYT
jgi:hypothetical protein